MLPLLLALLIHQGVPGGKLFRAVCFFPAMLSAVITGPIFNVVLPKERTVMAGKAAMRVEYTTNLPLHCAGIALAASPIIAIYIFFQRHIVDGIAVGAAKA
jgi:ABC-type glycerol-3-phosphate transport system permease component